MRTYAERYENVFFAYRGVAVADVDLSPGRQLEDNLTRALAVTLGHVSAGTRAAFLSEICGMEADAAATERATFSMQAVEGSGSAGVLVGISPTGGLATSDFEESPAGSRPDLLIELPDGRFVIIESKAVGGTDGSQLWRHARAFGLAVPERRNGRVEAPASWLQRTWSDVADWAERTNDDDPVAAFLLRELAEYLHLAEVTTRPVPRPAASAAAAVAPPEGEDEALLEAIAETVSLDAVARICKRLYGDPASPHYVHGDDESGHTYTTDDSAAVRASYRENREKVPPGLGVNGGNVITARRALCIAYGPKVRFMQSIATPQTRDAVGKLIGVGADRAVLLGLLAWAWPRSDTRAMRLRGIVARAWRRAPVQSRAAEELHEELGPAVRAALSTDL